MKQRSFSEQLRNALKEDVSSSYPRKKLRKELKNKLLYHISEMEQVRKENLILDRLRQYYSSPSLVQKKRVLQDVMNSVEEIERSRDFQLWSLFTLFGKKSLASLFAVLLLLSSLFAPLQTLESIDIVQPVRAAYLDCSGSVFVNGQLCLSGQIIKIGPGDFVETANRALATIFFADYSVIRLNAKTEISLDDTGKDAIQLNEGTVWLYAPIDEGRETLSVETPVLKARIPQGAVGITTDEKVTQLYSSTAAVEVQVDNSEGVTEVVTLPPEKTVTIRSTSQNTRIRETSLKKKEETWVEDNLVKDEQHLEVVKEKAVDETRDYAGVLPGSLTDYVGKVTSSARTALTWDEELKLERQMSELDELFSEVLVLLEKGDHTIALDTFEVYREKFVSLTKMNSDTVTQENSDPEDLLRALMAEHTRLMSPFSPGDPEYALKDSLQELAVSLDSDQEVPEEVIADVSSEKIVEAHNSLSDGNVEMAEEILNDTVVLEDMIEVTMDETFDTSDVAILNDILEKAPELGSVVHEIKKIKVEKMRSLIPQQEKRELVGSFVVGTAYKQELADEDQEEKTVKVIGQATKDENSL